MNETYVAFNEEYVSKPPDAEQVKSAITMEDRPKASVMLSDEALLDDETQAIDIVMQKNDIPPISRNDLEQHSSQISKHAIKKLATRVGSDYEVTVVQMHADSTNFFKKLHDRGEIGAFMKTVGMSKT